MTFLRLRVLCPNALVSRVLCSLTGAFVFSEYFVGSLALAIM
jgi:hypothetical protein